MRGDFESIKTEFLQLDALLTDLIANPREGDPGNLFRSPMARLNRLATDHAPDDVVQRLFSDTTLQPSIQRMARLRRISGMRFEIECAQSVIAHRDPWAQLGQFVYYPNYLALARMEYGGAGLQPEDRIVFLGSGPLPLSLICLSKGYDIQSVGIEQDEKIAALSREVIRKLGLNHRISVVHGNHFSLPLEGPCNLIMVGADASPKDIIFAHLSKILSPGQMIAYRIYEKGLRRLLDNQSMFDPAPDFVECARTHPAPPVNNTSVFAVRALSPAHATTDGDALPSVCDGGRAECLRSR